jgi:hypothetical protein
MIFRNIDGNLLEINKFDYKNDYLYYKKILELKLSFSKLNQINNSYNYSNYLINNVVNKSVL